MRVTGSATLHAPPGRVWAALADPAVLSQAIPGCEQLARTGPGTAQLTAAVAVASTPGTYTGEMRVTGRQAPHALALAATLTGEPGNVTGTAQIRLAGDPGGDTTLSYDAQGEVTGLLAAVGQSLLAAAATRQAAQFFAAIDTALAVAG